MSSLQRLLRGAVRPVRGTGQTGRREERRRSDESISRLGRPVRASSNAMETREEQYVEVGKVRVKQKSKDNKR